jgi:nitrogen fixation NifU-like protein
MNHYQHPKNRGKLSHPDFESEQYNPLCGDRVSMQGTIQDGQIRKLMFEGTGCVISQATASLLTQKVIGMTIADIQKLDADFIQSLIGISLGPTRLKCALLPLQAVHKGLETYARSHETDCCS